MSTSVGVNLLPQEVGEKNAARKMQAGIGAAGLGVLGLLALAYFWQVGQVNDAKAELALEQQEVALLQADVAELAEFQRLATQGESVGLMIAGLLSGEASIAGILQDFAAVTPSDANVESISIEVSGAGTGLVTSSGISLLGHAPGLERFLISFDKVAAFQNVFFGSSIVDVDGYANFSFSFDLTQRILTGRYLNGLPEVMR